MHAWLTVFTLNVVKRIDRNIAIERPGAMCIDVYKRVCLQLPCTSGHSLTDYLDHLGQKLQPCFPVQKAIH